MPLAWILWDGTGPVGMDRVRDDMEKVDREERSRRSLLSKQVSKASYCFLESVPSRRPGPIVAMAGRETCDPDYLVQRATYPFHVLEIVTSGAGRAVLDGRAFDLGVGSVFVTAPKTQCEIRCDRARPLVKSFVCFGGTRCTTRLARAGLVSGQPHRVSAVGEIAAAVDDLVREGRATGPHVREVCAHLFEVVLLKIASFGRPGGTSDEQHESAREHFLRCRNAIDAEVPRLATLGDVARAAGMDPSSVCRLFRRFQGISPYQYLLRRKMNLAAELLMERGGLVKEVGATVGFDDPFHFSRVFKAVHGVAPRAFVRALRSG